MGFLGPPDDIMSLQHRYAAGDRVALGELIERYRPALRKTAACYVGRDHAEDIVQELCLRLMRYASRYDPSLPWISLAKTSTCNLAISLLRKKAGLPPLPDGFDPIDPAAKPSDHQSEIRDEMERLKVCVEKLPENERAPLFLYFYDDLSVKEIAERLDANLQTIYGRTYRALAKVRECMTRRLNEGGGL